MVTIYDFINEKIIHKQVTYQGKEYVIHGLDLDEGKLKLLDSKDCALFVPIEHSNLLKIIEERPPQFIPSRERFAPSREKGCKY